jgi:hypothetical protein
MPRVERHGDCGEPVVVEAGRVMDPGGGEHLCSDYLAWHLPPDRRDPWNLDAPAWCPVIVLVEAA